ncbi:2-hydroxychromene-2-carboxylate isomerase [Planktotalea sp.]|uniref:2-hydroxychromene-2-carboxylate isomerase n=1 Tax=Planktotalea sp. TaxID=2029877 RepID=UPI0025CDD851|nr:2-hydroxychromene-2-carboxylate isomerase [Planktotalea sp.]
MPHIDYYFSTLSPYAYLAGTRLEEIAAKHGKSVNYKPLDLPALFMRTGGQLPKDRHPNKISYRAQELPRQAKKAMLPLNMEPAHWPMNAAPSCYAIIAASKEGGGDMGKLMQAFGRSIWVDDKDVSQDEVVRACLVEAGFDASIADKDMLSSAETYAANLEDAMNAGAFGAPFYVTDDDQRFWGQDRLDDLDAYLSGDL